MPQAGQSVLANGTFESTKSGYPLCCEKHFGNIYLQYMKKTSTIWGSVRVALGSKVAG